MKNFKTIVYIKVMLISIMINITTYAAVIHVPIDQPTIQSGIDAAKDGDTVLIAEGIYSGEGNVNIDFIGKQITVKSENGAESTIVDCERNPDTRGFIFQNKETNDAVLDGLTIRNGIYEKGGGIFCHNSSPTIINCVIEGNQATVDKGHGQGGGGIYCLNSAAIISECTITKNKANYGAGVLLEECEYEDDILKETCRTINLINCVISHNEGSGIFCFEGARPLIKDCTVSHNKARGIVYNWHVRSEKPITNCVVEYNSGGGLSVSEWSHLSISKSIIRYNSANEGGGIYCSHGGSLDISDCVVANNEATNAGGGIFVQTKWNDAEIRNCTITQNTSHEMGGGIYVWSQTSFSLTNSIVWGNNAQVSYDDAFIQQVLLANITVINCCIKNRIQDIALIFEWDIANIQGNIHEDPLFVDAENGDYRLKSNSPALAMGAYSTFDEIVSVGSVGKKVVLWGNLKRR